MNEVPYPVINDICLNPQHYAELLKAGHCHICRKSFGLGKEKEIDAEDYMEFIQDQQIKVAGHVK